MCNFKIFHEQNRIKQKRSIGLVDKLISERTNQYILMKIFNVSKPNWNERVRLIIFSLIENLSATSKIQ